MHWMLNPNFCLMTCHFLAKNPSCYNNITVKHFVINVFILLSLFAAFCTPDRCQNGGLCMEGTDTCQCVPGYSGENCETGTWMWKGCLLTHLELGCLKFESNSNTDIFHVLFSNTCKNHAGIWGFDLTSNLPAPSY